MNQKNKAKTRTLLLFVLLLLLCAGCAAFFLHNAARNRKDATGYTPDLTREFIVTQYADESGAQGTFYTITDDRSLIIIDGGWAENEEAVREVIAKHGNTVDAWILSHPHRDHAGAFNAIYASPDGITIKKIYDNGFDYDFIETAGEPYDDITVMENYHDLTVDNADVTHLKRGDVLDICGLTFTVLNAFDDVVLNNVGDEKDYQNNASLLLKVSSENSSMLFCSDIKYDMDTILLASCGDALACDYVQTGHHGNWSFSDAFYEKTGASVFFFDAPPEIMDNPDFPAGALKERLLEKKKTVLDFRTAPNFITLK